MASSLTQDFGNSNQNYNENSPANNSYVNNPSVTGPIGSTNNSDPVTATYGNKHSSTGHINPIHPSDTQSTAHPAYGNSKISGPYETGGGSPGQGGGDGGQVGNTSGTAGRLHNREYHRSVDAAYGHATGRKAPAGWADAKGTAGQYDTAGGNSAQSNPSQTNPHIGSETESSSIATATTTKLVDSDRSTGSKVKEMAHGVKGLFAAVHEAGENARGGFNAGVDRSFKEVLDPHPIPFPSLRPLEEFAEDGDGEFPASVFAPTSSAKRRFGLGAI